MILEVTAMRFPRVGPHCSGMFQGVLRIELTEGGLSNIDSPGLFDVVNYKASKGKDRPSELATLLSVGSKH